MKMLQLIDIGTKITDADINGDVETLFQIPIDKNSTMKEVYDALVEETEGDEFAVLALEKFISVQDTDSFDKNIYEGEKIVLETDDKNQYYMIFHLFEIKNTFESQQPLG